VNKRKIFAFLVLSLVLAFVTLNCIGLKETIEKKEKKVNESEELPEEEIEVPETVEIPNFEEEEVIDLGSVI